jgi:hypothetical protein
MVIGIGGSVGGEGVSVYDGPPRCGTNHLAAAWKAGQLALSPDGINFSERHGPKSVYLSLSISRNSNGHI